MKKYLVANVYVEYHALSLNRTFAYLCNNYQVTRGIRVKVRFAHREIIGFVDSVNELSEEAIKAMPYQLDNIIGLVDQETILNEEMLQLAKVMSKMYAASYISCLSAMLPTKLKPSSNNASIKYDYYVELVHEEGIRGPQQQQAVVYLKNHKIVKRKEFNKQFSCLTRLIAKGNVRIVKKESRNLLINMQAYNQNQKLNDEQQQVLNAIDLTNGYGVTLIHGVTGSGKTEVYLRLAENVLKRNKQVLILVPEIGLTPQMVERVSNRFNNQVAIYHSNLNNQQKYEQFQLVKEHKVQIVIGTRSAVFMPFDNLGLIVMDEEHDGSYKQDNMPAYHCRDIADYRCQKHRARLILASATPSLESYSRAYKGVYQLLEMKQRIHGNLPNARLINMREAIRNGEDDLISNELKEGIKQRLAKREQVIILLNRRGYTPILRCNDCGHVKTCPHCEMALNYHKASGRMVCHICGYSEPFIATCSQCGSHNLSYIGSGIQKLNERLQQLFPQARIIRMDADTTSRKGAHERILNDFGDHKYDILIGTQMVAKGLDYPNVSLVGIINGDALLSRSDYRSVEVTFDLLEQAGGRSGRGEKDGEVMIQAYDCEHFAIKCAAHHDYKTFFYQEMQFRHLGGYPPYVYLATLKLQNNDIKLLNQEMNHLLIDNKPESIKQLGPNELLKIKDENRLMVVFKCKNHELLVNYMNELFNLHQTLKLKSHIGIDIDPLNI